MPPLPGVPHADVLRFARRSIRENMGGGCVPLARGGPAAVVVPAASVASLALRAAGICGNVDPETRRLVCVNPSLHGGPCDYVDGATLTTTALTNET